MRIYLDLVMLLNFTVDLLLLLAANRVAGYPASIARCAAAAAIGGVYGSVCLLPGFHFLGNTLWRLVSLALISMAAFGWNRSALHRGVLFCLLSMALGGIAQGFESSGFLQLSAAAAVLGILCAVGFRRGSVGQTFVEVELFRGDRCVKLLALQDTGNTLRDPVTGQSVLVADATSAEELLGLTVSQLRDPVQAVASGAVPGLRLIPYRAVGTSGGMLAAVRLERVRIGKWNGSTLVAFSPDGLGTDGTYRALTGGIA